MITATGGGEEKAEARGPDRHEAEHEPAPAELRHRPSRRRRGGGAGEIGHEQEPEHRRGEVIRRCGEVEAHIGEDGDEVEQHAEPDRIDREQPRIGEVAQHLLPRGEKPLGAPEPGFARQRHDHHDGADSEIAASTTNAARQPTTSERRPGMRRPQNPPMLDPMT